MENWLREFDKLAFAKKLSLVPHKISGLRSSVALRDYTTDGTAQYWSSHRHFDVAKWINRGVIHRASWARAPDWLLYWHY
jgi:hypothetical protein